MTGVKSPMRFTDSGNGHKVTVSFDESVFTNGVLWQQDAESFVCMEPWNGWANSVNEAGHHIELNPGESKEFKWSGGVGAAYMRPGRFPQASVYHTLPGRACPAPTVQLKQKRTSALSRADVLFIV